MAELKGMKRRLSMNFSFLNPNDQNPQIVNNNNSYKKFEAANGVVGLGIVAALDQTNVSGKSNRAVIWGVSPRSTPIPISGNYGGSNFEDMELSEDYTCVIAHIGNNLIKKREYFDGNLTTKCETIVGGEVSSYWVCSGVLSASSPPPAGESEGKDVFGTADFLSFCFLCKKKLHGLDIFMYRGENAFCSAECRDKHITADEHKEKHRSRAKKPQENLVSPFSEAMQFFAGVATA